MRCKRLRLKAQEFDRVLGLPPVLRDSVGARSAITGCTAGILSTHSAARPGRVQAAVGDYRIIYQFDAAQNGNHLPRHGTQAHPRSLPVEYDICRGCRRSWVISQRRGWVGLFDRRCIFRQRFPHPHVAGSTGGPAGDTKSRNALGEAMSGGCVPADFLPVSIESDCGLAHDLDQHRLPFGGSLMAKASLCPRAPAGQVHRGRDHRFCAVKARPW